MLNGIYIVTSTLKLRDVVICLQIKCLCFICVPHVSNNDVELLSVRRGVECDTRVSEDTTAYTFRA